MFQWRDDRFGHTVFLDDDEVATSIEGDADDEWPSSPPIQQLSLESAGESNVLLGVGGAGTSHWSISVELSSDPVAAKFDLACRFKSEPSQIGSAYRIGDAVELAADANAACAESAEGSRRVEPVGGDSGSTSGTVRWTYRIALNSN